MTTSRTATLSFLLLAATSATAQATQPHFSTFFGGSDLDVPMAIHRAPGDVITVVGHTRSPGLATPGAFQQAIVPAPVPQTNGDVDAFVARFAPNPGGPGHVLQWYTYLGGSGLELAFDLAVDAAGVTTIVGLTSSSDFPDPTGSNPPPLQGGTDGFVAQIDANGTTLLSSMFVGGSGDDRLSEVELDPVAGLAIVAGNTESTNLPGAVNTFHGGVIDAFVAQVVPANPGVVLWSTYLGGNNTDGLPFAGWPGFASMWEGNLDRMALALDASGNPALATVSFFAGIPAYTTPNAIQSQSGQGDVYLAVLDRNAPWPPTYGTFFGGTANDRPKAIARHPAGGFVVSGVTASLALLTTPGCFQSTPSPQTGSSAGEAFVTWIDPAQGNRYTTYFGGGAGEDNAHAMAIESSGVVTVGGYSYEGSIPTTPRCLSSTPGPTQTFGLLARFDLGGNGARDLLYASLLGTPWGGNTSMLLTGLALDEVGDAWWCGRCNVPTYPLVNEIQGHAGGSDMVLTHMPLLPGNVQREFVPLAVPACGAPPYTGAGSAPVPGETFVVTAANAPPDTLGLLVLGDRLPPAPLPPPFNGTLLVNPIVLSAVLADGTGGARFELPVPATATLVPSWNLAAQWFFFTTPTCPGTGTFATSERLAF